MTDDRKLQMLRTFASSVPHNRALGMEIVSIGERTATFRLPYSEQLVGDPTSGVIHGGAITALIDACCGLTVLGSLTQLQPIATLDLRIDYLGQAVPHQDVFARAECYKLTRNVAFVRATAYQSDEHAPIASSAGTFMIGTKAGNVRGKS